jgi:hypothetical protein
MYFETIDSTVEVLQSVLTDVSTGETKHTTWAVRNVDVAKEQLKLNPARHQPNVKKAIILLSKTFNANTKGSTAFERWESTRNNPNLVNRQGLYDATVKAIELLRM